MIFIDIVRFIDILIVGLWSSQVVLLNINIYNVCDTTHVVYGHLFSDKCMKM